MCFSAPCTLRKASCPRAMGLMASRVGASAPGPVAASMRCIRGHGAYCVDTTAGHLTSHDYARFSTTAQPSEASSLPGLVLTMLCHAAAQAGELGRRRSREGAGAKEEAGGAYTSFLVRVRVRAVGMEGTHSHGPWP